MTAAGEVSTAIAGRLTVAELVATYERAERDIRAAFGTVAGALKSLDACFSLEGHGFDLRRNRRNYGEGTNWAEPEDHLRELRRQVWGLLVERMEIRKAMSIKAWDDLQKQISDEEPPPIDAVTVHGIIDQFRAEIPDMLQAAVAEVFEWLRPPSSQYKTNTEFEIGERVVLRWCVERSYGKWGVNDRREQNLVALENVFAMVGGAVPVHAHGGYYSEISTAIKACPPEKCHGATPLVEFRGYRNGNLHLRFRRMDLVARLNAVAGGARLKPPASAECRP